MAVIERISDRFKHMKVCQEIYDREANKIIREVLRIDVINFPIKTKDSVNDMFTGPGKNT